MKKILVIATLLAATVSFAQRTKTTTYTTTTTTPVTYSSGQNELTAHVGFASSAINLGATYAHMEGATGFGGYFHLQTEKSKVVDQAMAIGALYKINVVETANSIFYAAPGFGIAMVKIPSTTGTGTDDKTIFGPSMKLGAQIKLTPAFALGLERALFTNWFEEKVDSGFEITTVAMTFNF